MKRKVMTLRPSPNEEARLIKEECERRRKLRIQQVREQHRLVSQQIRQAVEQRRQHELDLLGEQLRLDWERQQQEELDHLQRLYQESLQLLGQGHRSAKENEPDLAAMAQQKKENHAKAEQRYREALKELKSQRLKDHERQNQILGARKKALQTEKERSAKVASLPPPPPDPIQNIDAKKPHVVTKSDVGVFAATRYNMPESSVDREVDTPKVNAHEEAKLEGQRLQELQKEERRRREEQLEKARVRGREALRRERSAQDRERLLAELEHLQQTDLLRRRQQVAQMPAQIFQPLYKRQEAREELQREMEFAFEEMYTGERRVKGDLVLQLEPEPLPALSTGSQDQELDVTTDEVTEAARGDASHEAEEETASLQEETTALAETSKSASAPRRALRMMLDRIRAQRDQLTELSSQSSAAGSSPVRTDQIPERESTIEAGSLTSEMRDWPRPPEPAHASLDVEEVKPSDAADSQLSDELTTRIQEYGGEQRKREEELERERQQQQVLLQELEEQKDKLEQMLLEAREERDQLKQAMTQEVSLNHPDVTNLDQEVSEVTDVTSGSVAEVEPPAGEDDHTRRLREYQQRLLQQNRIHHKSVEVARRRLEEYQRALRIRYNMNSSLLPGIVPPGLTRPPLHQPLSSATEVSPSAQYKPQTLMEVPTRDSDPLTSPRVPGPSARAGPKLLPDEKTSGSGRPEVTARLTDDIMERVTEHLPPTVRHSPSQAGSLSSRGSNMDVQRSMTEQVDVVMLQQRYEKEERRRQELLEEEEEKRQEEERQRRELLQEVHRRLVEQRQAVSLQQEEGRKRRELQDAKRRMEEEERRRRELQNAQRLEEEERRRQELQNAQRLEEEERRRREMHDAQRHEEEERRRRELQDVQQRRQEEERKRQELQDILSRMMEERLQIQEWKKQALQEERQQEEERQLEEERQRPDLQDTQRREQQLQEAVDQQQKILEEQRRRQEEEMEQMKQQKETLQALIHSDAQEAAGDASDESLSSSNVSQTRLQLLSSLLRAIEEKNGGSLSHLEEPDAQTLGPEPDPGEFLFLPPAPPPPRSAKPPVTRIKLGIMEAAEQHELSVIPEVETPANISLVTGLDHSMKLLSDMVDSFPQEDSDLSVTPDPTLQATPESSREHQAPKGPGAPGIASDFSSLHVWRDRQLIGAETPPDLVPRVISPSSSDSGRGADFSAAAVTRSFTKSPHRRPDSECLSSTTISTGSLITTDPEQNLDKSPDVRVSEDLHKDTDVLSVSPATAPLSTEDAAGCHDADVQSLFNDSNIQRIIDRYTRELNLALNSTGGGTDGDASCVDTSGSLVQIPIEEEDGGSAGHQVLPSETHSVSERDQSVNPDLDHLQGAAEDSFRPLIGQPADQSSCLAGDHRESSMEQLVGQPAAQSSMIGLLPVEHGWDSTLSRMFGRLSCQPGSHWPSGGQDHFGRQLIGPVVPAQSTTWLSDGRETSGMRPLAVEADTDQHSGISAGEVTQMEVGVSAAASLPPHPSLPPEAPSHTSTVQTVRPHPEDQDRSGQTEAERMEDSDSFHSLLAEFTDNETVDPSVVYDFHQLPHSQWAGEDHSVSSQSQSLTDPSVESEPSPERFRSEGPAPPGQSHAQESVLELEEPEKEELTALSLSNQRKDIPLFDKIMEAASEVGILEQSQITLVSVTDTTPHDTTVAEEDGVWEGNGEEETEHRETEGAVSLPEETVEEEVEEALPAAVKLLEFEWGHAGGRQDLKQQKLRALQQRSTQRAQLIKAKNLHMSDTGGGGGEGRPKSNTTEELGRSVSCVKVQHQGNKLKPGERERRGSIKQRKCLVPPAASDLVLKTMEESEQRRREVSEMYQRTRRLYDKLEEVKQQKTLQSRQEAYAKNRQKAKEFHKKTLEKLRHRRSTDSA